MPRPGDVLSRVVERYTANGATAVPSLVTADFTPLAYKDGVLFALTHSYTWISGPRYKFSYTLPSVKGLVDIQHFPATGTNMVYPNFSGYVSRNDIDSVAAVNRPSAIAAASAGIGQDFPLTLVWNTYDEIEATIYESDLVTPVDLSGWDAWQFEVNNLNHAVETALPALITSGITADINGLIRIIVPENAALYTPMATAFVESGRQLRYTLTGNQGGDATKTRCVLRGSLTIVRREKPT